MILIKSPGIYAIKLGLFSNKKPLITAFINTNQVNMQSIVSTPSVQCAITYFFMLRVKDNSNLYFKLEDGTII